MEELIELKVKFLKVLADSTRLKIILLLKAGESTANTIQDTLRKSQSTISQQLKILVDSDILEARRDGVKKYYSIKHPHIFDVISSIDLFLSESKQKKVGDLTSLDIVDTLH
ncbi:MAG: ArsR/SmtB family transcription factor [Candidatus Helarchaeota archaeon]